MRNFLILLIDSLLFWALAASATPQKLSFPKGNGLYTFPKTSSGPSQISIRLELVNNGNVTLTMQGPTAVFFAVGFGSSMSSADAIVYSTGLNDKYGTEKVMNFKLKEASLSGVSEQPEQYWETEELKQVGSNTYFKVTRFMSDPKARGIHNFNMGDTLLQLIWAHGYHQTLYYHANQAHVEINMVTGAVTTIAPQVSTARKVHGILMVLAWLMCCPLAVLSSRFRNMLCCTVESLEGTINWFWFHRFFVFLIFVFQAIAFLLILKDKAWTFTFVSLPVGGFPNGTPHVKFGIAVLCWYVVQVVGGLMRPDKYAPNRLPWFIFHRYGGLGLWVFSCFTIYFGIIQAQLEGQNEFVVAFGMLIGAIVLSFVVGTAASAQKSVTPEGYHQHTAGEDVSVIETRTTN